MVKTALSIGANTFAFFTRNPRGSKAKKEDAADAEKAVFQPQLENIVKYVEKIASVDVTDVPPTMHGREIVNAFREDVVRPSLDREAALANAPARTGDEFMLPKIVEGAES